MPVNTKAPAFLTSLKTLLRQRPIRNSTVATTNRCSACGRSFTSASATTDIPRLSPNHNSFQSSQPAHPHLLDYDLPANAPAQQRTWDGTNHSTDSIATLDFSQLPQHILEDEDRMGCFTSAARNRAQLSIIKHNAECEVRDCEKLLEIRREQLHDASVGLLNAHKVLGQLWEAAVHPSNASGDSCMNTRCNDAESTASEASY